MIALSHAKLDLLAKVAGMFGSEHDGERAAAAAHADRIVRGAGLTWGNVLQPAAPARQEREHICHPTPSEILVRHGHKLTPWEREFLGSIARRYKALTPKQSARLSEIRIRAASR